MKLIDYCSCCLSKNVILNPAKISVFVYDRMLGISSPRNDISCQAVECLDCGFVSTDIRFDREEEKRYYYKYMSDDYINHRCDYDGYSLKPMLEAYESEFYKTFRKNALTEILSKEIDISKIKSVLDYGGDDGSLIPNVLDSSKKYIVEISEKSLDKSVISIASQDDIEKVDLLLCCHTLEHVSYPLDLLNDMKKYMKSGSWIYLEVPDNEPPNKNYFHEHINLFRLPTLEKFLLDNNFVDVKGYKIPYNHYLLESAIAVIGKLR